MKKLIAYLLLTTSSAWAGLPPTTARPQTGSSSVMFQTQAPFNQITKTSGTAGLVETGNTNIIGNPGFEATTGTSLWTASGGTFTTTTTTADVGSGMKAGSWDSNSASQTLTSTAVAIPAGDYGANYEVSANLKCASGSCTHLLQAFDGTNVIASKTIISSLTYQRTLLEFPAPTSGNISARLTSVASDEPTIYVDDVYVGRARNVGSVAQAELVGTVRITGCAGAWSGTSATYANYSTQTGCSYSVTGSVEAPTTNIPGVRLRNRPPGKYVFSYTGNAAQTTAGSECFFRVSDGVNNSIEENSPFSGASLAVNFLDFSIEYGSGSSDLTVQIQQKRTSGSASCQISGTTANPGVIKIYRYPLSSEIAYRAEQAPGYSFITLNNNASVFQTTTSSSFVDVAPSGIHSSRVPEYRASVCSNADQVCTRYENMPVGNYEITLNSSVYDNLSGGCEMRFTDGTNNSNVALREAPNQTIGESMVFQYYNPSVATRELKFQFRRRGSSGNCGYGTGYTFAASISVKPVSQSIPAPNLVGSVTSLSTGSERIESAEYGSAGGAECSSSPCTVLRPSSNWISGITRSTTGDYQMTINSGVFASQPKCFITEGSSAGIAVSIIPVSANVFNIRARISSSGTGLDNRASLMCIGPRGNL